MAGRATILCVALASCLTVVVERFCLRPPTVTGATAHRAAFDSVAKQTLAESVGRFVTAKRPTFDSEQATTLYSVSFHVPADATVIFASLNQSAATHEVHLHWHDRTSPLVSSLDELQAACDFARVAQDKAADSRRWPTASANVPSHDPNQHNSFRTISESAETPSPIVRRFRVPWFCNQQSYDRYAEGHLLAEGRRIRVFGEDRPTASGSSANGTAQDLARTIVSLAEGGILQHVESRVGSLSDIDSDQRLSILLCPLSDEWVARDLSTDDSSANVHHEPIRGCVRGTDFLYPLSPFEGDVVYLDSRIDDRRQLKAVLAHELTHAAVFSAATPATRLTMPSWLNEAVAHLIELEVCPDSPNLQERFVEFRENPNRYSVVLSDQASGQSTRRGASRAAGCSFLASALSTRPAADLKRLVTSSMQHADPIECTTGRSFAAMFRNWTVEMCDSVSPSTDRSPNSRRLSLAGTSFAVERPSNGSRTLNIQFPAAAMLQVTVAQGGSGEETLNTAESAGRTAR